MAHYTFTTQWHLAAPISAVWETLGYAPDYPVWWPHIAQTELLPAAHGAQPGEVWRVHWKTALPYDLIMDSRTTRVEPPYLREVESLGELVGTGCWTLREVAGGTAVRYDWAVATTPLWMNLLAPLIHFLFSWNHHQVMESGATGLALRLGVAVRDIHHTHAVRIAGRPAGQVSALVVAGLLAGALVIRGAAGRRWGRAA